MRISDWISDVCSPDLSKGSDRNIESRAPASPAPVFMPGTGFREFSDGTAIRASGPVLHLVNDFHGAELGSAGDGTARKHRDRKSVVLGTLVFVRFTFVGRRHLKNKKILIFTIH